MDNAVFKSTLTKGRVEHAYQQANLAMERRNISFGQIGMRAAKARDAKLLIALEMMAEHTGSIMEEQFGRTMRSPDATYGESRGTTEHQLCREAYRLCDEGRPIENLMWIYGAAAYLCGYVI